MEIIFFESAMVSRKTDGDLLIALFDGSIERSARQQCVCLLVCRSETAIAFKENLGSALKPQTEQGDAKS